MGHGVGLSGIAGFVAWLLVARRFHLDGPEAALVALVAAGGPMIAWSLVVERVHRRPSTGLDWRRARPWRQVADRAALAIAGTWATWAGMALIYAAGRFWWQPPFAFALHCLLAAVPVLLILSVPYLAWLERHRVEGEEDGAWHLGAWLAGQPGWSGRAIREHLLAWAVKGFFLPFMLAILPGGFAFLVRLDGCAALADPVAFAAALTAAMFALDVVIATLGYLLTLRPLDAQIRSANPFAAGWAAALVCYPPFLLMESGGPLDYRPGTRAWSWWYADHPWLLWGWATLLVTLTAIYAWSTVAFGVRFSNLTNRGVLTHGPYRWSRHPAYLSKNLYWLAITLPVLTVGGWLDAVRATLLMGAVAGVYWARARTEERHLLADPAYRDYHAWMSRHGAIPRLVAWVTGR